MSEIRVGGIRVYGQHGERHQPWGSDPSLPGVWIVVGEDPRVPYITGFPSAPSDTSPNPTALQFRISLGQPNDCHYAGWGASVSHPSNVVTAGGDPVATDIVEYRDHQLEIEGDVDGVVPGDVVFIIPMEFRFVTDLPYKGHDNDGNYVPCRLLSTGEFVYGVP